MKYISYGIDDFESIIKDGYYYGDMTRYIPYIEEDSPYLLFVRPRGMGKSLFVKMLMNYYDIANSHRFDELFGNLWIGRHKTPNANKYLILDLDFSHSGAKLQNIKENFKCYVFEH